MNLYCDHMEELRMSLGHVVGVHRDRGIYLELLHMPLVTQV